MIKDIHGFEFETVEKYLSVGEPGYVAFKFSDGSYGLHICSHLSAGEIIQYSAGEFIALLSSDFEYKENKIISDEYNTITEIYEFNVSIDQLNFFNNPEECLQYAHKAYEYIEAILTLDEIREKFNLPKNTNIIISR